jgi:bacteriocin-like protein
MSKSETMTTDTGTAGEPAALTDKELDAVTGGATPKLYEAACKGTHHVPSGHEGWIEVQSYQWG